MPVPRLSILIPTLPSRREKFATLVQELERQAAGLPVEILALYDNKTIPLGRKRNSLMDMAQGTHMVFIDDDDRVAEDYVAAVLGVIEREDPDCLVYEQEVRGDPPIRCRYGRELTCKQGTNWWTGKPAHTMVWRAEIARSGRFPERSFGEDAAWVDQVDRKSVV